MEAVLNQEPLLYPFLWTAFDDLCTERLPMGMEQGRIPVSKMYEYAAREQCSPAKTEILVYAIKRLDSHHMESVRAKQAKQEKSKNKGSTVNGRSLINTDLL